ncbi:MAG: tetratricopeptide repeat protein [Planctomycetota bacterium]
MSDDPTEAKRQELYLEGLALFGKDQHEEAVAKYDAALALDPDWTEALHGKAMALMRLERYDEAIEIGKRIVELDPDDAFAHTSLSMFYQRKGMIDEAEAEGAKARMISWKEELRKNPDAPPPGPAGSMNVIQ